MYNQSPENQIHIQKYLSANCFGDYYTRTELDMKMSELLPFSMPMVVFTFLEEYDFFGKTIIPLCTREGSRMGGSESDIRKLCPAAKVLKGLPINSNVPRLPQLITKKLPHSKR